MLQVGDKVTVVTKDHIYICEVVMVREKGKAPTSETTTLEANQEIQR